MLGNVGFHALRDLGKALRDEFHISTFIETGTYKGETTAWAATEFEKVVTIEAYKPNHDKTKAKLKAHKNTRFVFGDSRTKLKAAVSQLRSPALIWLDAHWCGNYELAEGNECPLIEELETLRASKTDHLILIDDARLFTEPPPAPHDPAQWPTLQEIEDILPDHYRVTIWNDAIICVPQRAAAIVERFTRPSEMEVIVLTSNKYVHCLPAFAYLFNKFWDAGQAVKVVRYDVRPAKLPGNFSNFAIGNQANYTWSSGLSRYLTYHTGNLVLLMLEDYFIDRPVGDIKSVWDFMLANPNVVKVDLSGDRQKVAHTEWNELFIQSANDAPFQTSLQAAIWRKDFLISCLDPAEDAWQFEKQGTKRVIERHKAGEFDGLILGCKNPPLSYINAKGGMGTQPDKWDKMPEWMRSELGAMNLL